MKPATVAIVGGGPAGLAAAELLSSAGNAVTIYEAMPTPGRKFLLAGKSGLNITHSEAFPTFAGRFAEAEPRLRAALEAFTPADLREWAQGLGSETFVGTSGRVFPTAMKASPLLRAWKARLDASGAKILTRHRWIGFDGAALRFETPAGQISVQADAVLLALGGASWPRLGSDAAWVPWLRDKGVAIAPFEPANCGFDVAWSPLFRDRFAGAPVKSVIAQSAAGTIRGEFVITRHGIEGSLIYAHSRALREALVKGEAALMLDLVPDRGIDRLTRDLAHQPAKASLSTRLRKAAGLEGVKAALPREVLPQDVLADPARLAAALKALPVPLMAPRPIAEAISSAGGISWDEIDEAFMLRRRPGLFVAGEMIDWEAPTGGYLLTACLASGRAAANGMLRWMEK